MNHVPVPFFFSGLRGVRPRDWRVTLKHRKNEDEHPTDRPLSPGPQQSPVTPNQSKFAQGSTSTSQRRSLLPLLPWHWITFVSCTHRKLRGEFASQPRSPWHMDRPDEKALFFSLGGSLLLAHHETCLAMLFLSKRKQEPRRICITLTIGWLGSWFSLLAFVFPHTGLQGQCLVRGHALFPGPKEEDKKKEDASRSIPLSSLSLSFFPGFQFLLGPVFSGPPPAFLPWSKRNKERVSLY